VFVARAATWRPKLTQPVYSTRAHCQIMAGGVGASVGATMAAGLQLARKG